MLLECMVVAIFMCFTGVTGHMTSRRPEISTPVISHVTSHTCDDNPYVNGCTIPIRSYRRLFQAQCNRHDICYTCGSEYGISRRSCDVIFGQSIAERCDSSRDQTWCHMLTYVSYVGVRLGGRRQFSRFSPSWCTDGWVSSCL